MVSFKKEVANWYPVIEMVAEGRKCPIHVSFFADEYIQWIEVCEPCHMISQTGRMEELMYEYEEENCTYRVENETSKWSGPLSTLDLLCIIVLRKLVWKI